MRTFAFVLVAVALASSCAVKKIPGTEIDDTSDTRAILDVLTKYRQAVEARNAQGVVALVDEASFRDDGGSPNAKDHHDGKTLGPWLTDLFAQLEDVRVDINVRKVEYDEDAANAKVTYNWSESFRMPNLTSKTTSETDLKQMTLKRVGEKEWKIVSGI